MTGLPPAVGLVSSLLVLPGIESVVTSAARRGGGVLIAGEPGSGREALARAIHGASSRAKGPFVAIDCAADPDRSLWHLLDRTGRPTAGQGTGRYPLRRTRRDGDPLQMDGGTLFLRNPFDLPLPIQGRLARVLRDAELLNSGDGRSAMLNVRPIAAVDGGFRPGAGDGTVRPELYRRFAAVRIDLTPLRARPGDIPEFAQALANLSCQHRQMPPKRLAGAASALLAALPWWGNVVELRDLIDVLVRQVTGAVIDLGDVLGHVRLDRARAAPVAVGSLREARMRFERDYISTVLARHNGRMVDVAAELGLERANLYRKMRQLGIRRQTA